MHYVGKSSCGFGRPRKRHLALCGDWTRELRAAGFNYEIVVLELVADPKSVGVQCWWWTGKNTTALCDAERWWIAFGRALGWPLTNLTDGGDGISGYQHRSESRAKARAAALRQWQDPDRRAVIIVGQLTPEERARRSAQMKERVSSPEMRARIKAALTPEVVAKRSASVRAVSCGEHNPAKRPEVRIKISKAKLVQWQNGTMSGMRGRKHSPDTIAKMSAARAAWHARRAAL